MGWGFWTLPVRGVSFPRGGHGDRTAVPYGFPLCTLWWLAPHQLGQPHLSGPHVPLALRPPAQLGHQDPGPPETCRAPISPRTFRRWPGLALVQLPGDLPSYHLSSLLESYFHLTHMLTASCCPSVPAQPAMAASPVRSPHGLVTGSVRFL